MRSITVGPDRLGDEIATAVGSLLEDERRPSEARRVRRGRSPRASVVAAPAGFAAAVEDAVRVALDPIRPSMDRWASAVADLGGDERSLEAGYFLKYAEALTSFSGSPQEPDRGAGDPLLHSG